MLDYASGTVHTVVFSDESQPFYILKVADDSGSTVMMRGPVIGTPPTEGDWLGAEGKWVHDPKWGKQFRISRAPIMRGGWDDESAAKALGNQGIGSLTVRKLQLLLEDDFVESLSSEEKLASLDGISEFDAAAIARAWTRVRAFFEAIPALSAMGFDPKDVNRIFSKWGTESVEVLTEDPWALTDLPGFDFGAADRLATMLQVPISSPQRLRGACVQVVRAARKSGHAYLTLAETMGQVKLLVSTATNEEIALALKGAADLHRLVIERDLGETLIYIRDLHKAEKASAESLLTRLAVPQADLAFARAMKIKHPKSRKRLSTLARDLVRETADDLGLALSEAQEQGVINALLNPVSIITGLPGTGKTTSLRVLVRALQEAGLRTNTGDEISQVLLMAPTGIAAKRMASVTGVEAYTVHRGLGGKPQTDVRQNAGSYTGIVSGEKSQGWSASEWSYGDNNKHPASVVVIDESSMVDLDMLYRIIEGVDDSAHLVFMGDAAQLPSVGPGNVLRDLVTAGCIPTVHLTEIFRQEETSDIVTAAHAIHAGEVPDTGGDFRLVPAGTEAEALKVVQAVTQKLFDKGLNFQVLSPRHAGDVGVTNLNETLREMFNPSGARANQLRIATGYVREGDRVMIVQNDYDMEVYNGDVGKVTSINLKKKSIEVKIHGAVSRRIPMKPTVAVRLLRLAYAQTVHKSQGQEYEIIVLPLLDGFSIQLQRNLLYTAITRAKQKVILVGTESALSKAVFNDFEGKRNSALSMRLKT